MIPVFGVGPGLGGGQGPAARGGRQTGVNRRSGRFSNAGPWQLESKLSSRGRDPGPNCHQGTADGAVVDLRQVGARDGGPAHDGLNATTASTARPRSRGTSRREVSQRGVLQVGPGVVDDRVSTMDLSRPRCPANPRKCPKSLIAQYPVAGMAGVTRRYLSERQVTKRHVFRRLSPVLRY